MPSLLGFAEEDPILQIEVDNSRNILYTRSEKGTVTVKYLEYLFAKRNFGHNIPTLIWIQN